MSASAVALSGSSSLYDFTTAQLQAYGTDPMKALSGGVFGMIAGDANGDGTVKFSGTNNDRLAVLSVVGLADITNVVSGYNNADLNLDGAVKFSGALNDRLVVLATVGLADITATKTTQVP